MPKKTFNQLKKRDLAITGMQVLGYEYVVIEGRPTIAIHRGNGLEIIATGKNKAMAWRIALRKFNRGEA